jgi:hypothetical protein
MQLESIQLHAKYTLPLSLYRVYLQVLISYTIFYSMLLKELFLALDFIRLDK